MDTVTIESSYKACRKLNFRFGSTYFWASQLLPPERRPFVHSIYAFCRYADDIVDSFDETDTDGRRLALTEFGDQFFADLERGQSDHLVLAAVIDTVRRLEIDPECFQRFLKSMHMDFDISTYETFDDLMIYMDGSAAVIGEMMLPVLQPRTPDALEPARQLGVAFQLTNFLRDVGEDLDRGRIYIPQSTLRNFGAVIDLRQADDNWIAAMQMEIDRTRKIYLQADAGIEMLPNRSARCVRAARRLYSSILDEIEANQYDVFNRRARVPYWKKLVAAAR